MSQGIERTFSLPKLQRQPCPVFFTGARAERFFGLAAFRVLPLATGFTVAVRFPVERVDLRCVRADLPFAVRVATPASFEDGFPVPSKNERRSAPLGNR